MDSVFVVIRQFKSVLKAMTDPLTDEVSENSLQVPYVEGELYKWTNYIHGWQRRYVILKDGIISYYRSQLEQSVGCKGAVNAREAEVRRHETDLCRFDISLNDSQWCFRTESPEERLRWLDALAECRSEPDVCGECYLRCDGSFISLASVRRHAPTVCKSCKELKEKLERVNTCHRILTTQLDTLQKHFDSYAQSKSEKNTYGKKKMEIIEFKAESTAFKITSDAMLSTLTECVELITKKEVSWKLKSARERRLSQRLKASSDDASTSDPAECKSGDEEFYDALDPAFKTGNYAMTEPDDPVHHKLWTEIDRVTKEQLELAGASVGSHWQLLTEDNDLRVYKKIKELDGMAMDSIKASHVVRGVTGREVCHYFFGPQYREEWDPTVERASVVERISDRVLVFHQLHKRIWPVSQRDSLFWSRLTKAKDSQGQEVWAVVNHSIESPDYPQREDNCLRLLLTACLYCRTLVTPTSPDSDQLIRDNIACTMIYCAVVNPGGWVPSFALRAVYRKEYPKFFKNFSAYVISQRKDKPILL